MHRNGSHKLKIVPQFPPPPTCLNFHLRKKTKAWKSSTFSHPFISVVNSRKFDHYFFFFFFRECCHRNFKRPQARLLSFISWTESCAFPWIHSLKLITDCLGSCSVQREGTLFSFFKGGSKCLRHCNFCLNEERTSALGQESKWNETVTLHHRNSWCSMVKGIIYPKIKIRTTFSIIPNMFDILSLVEHKKTQCV